MELEFEHIENVAWLAGLLPAAFFWYAWERKKVSIRKGMADSPRLLGTLLKNNKPGNSKWQLLRFMVAYALMVLAIMNPRMVDEKANVHMEGVQVMVAIDVSNSMLATDVAPNRLERARTFAIKLSESFGGSRIGLVGFAGEARLLMPPTTDLSAIRQALQTIGPSSIPMQGTNIEAALTEAHLSLTSDALAYKGLVLITDGEELDGAALQMAQQYAKSGLQVHVVGVGTPDGALLSNPETGLPLMNSDDQQVISRLDSKLLQDLASNTGGTYTTLTAIDPTVLTVSEALNNLPKIALPNTELINYYSFTSWVILFVIILFSWDWWRGLIAGIHLRRRARISATIFLCFFMQAAALAQQVGIRMKAGTDAYRSGDWQAALQAFNQVLEAEPTNVQAQFYRGIVSFKLSNFDDAAVDFSSIAGTNPDPEIRSAAHNNAGLAYAQAKKLNLAIDALKQALKDNPGDAEIRQNLQKALVEYRKQNPESNQDKKKPPPPIKEEDANRKLQSIMDEERKVREKMKQKGSGGATGKNW